jgi:hypothetical protein
MELAALLPCHGGDATGGIAVGGHQRLQYHDSSGLLPKHIGVATMEERRFCRGMTPGRAKRLERHKESD